jgi:hypothetical protein
VPTLALYAYWRVTGIRGPETRVEAGSEEWFWGAPLPDGTFNATVLVDPARCTASGRRELEPFYRSLLSRSLLLRDCLNGVLSSPVLACDASSYVDDHPADESSIKVGESSFSIDPLSSQGVQAAITTGLQGSIVVHTMLRLPGNAEAAMRFYRDRQTETVARHRRLAAGHYAASPWSRDHLFWRRRAALQEDAPSHRVLHSQASPIPWDCRIKLSDEASLVEMPSIEGNFVRSRRALTHPGLERPLVYLQGTAVAPLLDAIAGTATLGELVRRWSSCLPLREGLEIARWLCESGIVVPAEDLL